MDFRYSWPLLLLKFTFEPIEQPIYIFINISYSLMHTLKLNRIYTLMFLQFFCDISLIISKGLIQQLQYLSFYSFMTGMKPFMNMLYRILCKIWNISLFIPKLLPNSKEKLLTLWFWHLEVASKSLRSFCLILVSSWLILIPLWKLLLAFILSSWAIIGSSCSIAHSFIFSE